MSDEYKERYLHALDCVDQVFQEGATGEPALLPNFLRVGDDKFEGVVKLAVAYLEMEDENKYLRKACEALLVCGIRSSLSVDEFINLARRLEPCFKLLGEIIKESDDTQH